MKKPVLAAFALIYTAASVCAQNLSSRDFAGPPGNVLPDFVRSAITHNTYDGVTNDLLTAGLGKSGLQGGPPPVMDSANPTTTELRSLAIYNNYRALLDITTSGGFGVLYAD
jgi:hydroxybutyrate-dimer hydrolase